MYDNQLGRWHVIDPLADKYYPQTGYGYVMNNPLKLTDPTGMFSTHTDENGNVVAVFDDGDLGVYRHSGGEEEALNSVQNNYSTKNTSTGGELMGETWTALGFANFERYTKDGSIVPANNAKIDFSSNWASEEIDQILNENPLLGEYAYNARYGQKWDLKSQTGGKGSYFGSKLFGKYASARDAGNFLAGAMAELSILPNGMIDYGYGVYNLSDNKIMKSIEMVAGDVMELLFRPPLFKGKLPAYDMKVTAASGEHPLSRAGISAGKDFIKQVKKK